MPDDKSKRHPQDGKRINIHEPYEVRSWCNILNTTESQLRAAVRAVGTSATAVKKYLNK